MSDIHVIRTGPLGVNTLIVPLCDKKVFVVDPAACSVSRDESKITDYLLAKKLECVAVVLTHTHFDHIMGIASIKKAFPDVKIAVHEAEKDELQNPPGRMNSSVLNFFGAPELLAAVSEQPPADILLKDNDSLWNKFFECGNNGISTCIHGLEAEEESTTLPHGLGGAEKSTTCTHGPGGAEDSLKKALSSWRVIHTPGHSPGSVCYYNKNENILISGDTLFDYGGYGRTDMYGGDEAKIRHSLGILREKVAPGTRVYPGHESFGFSF